MAEYLPPTENLPIFDVTVFRNDNPYSDLYLARIGLATSEAVQTDFSGLVNFNNISTPPHCSAVPINGNDLANKSYVDALAPQTSYIVHLNYTETFTTTTPTVYKKLNPDEVYTPTLIPFATTNTTPVLIAGFFNTKAALLFADVIPAGNWNLVLFANCDSTTDQNHLELNYSLIGITAGGVETVIYTSAYSNTINVIAPQIGTYSCQLTIPSTSILAYTQIGIKVYVRSNINANRSGNIFFQYTSSYSSLQTSFGTTQASNILTTNNTWTGINTFNNTTNLNGTVLQSGTLTFPDATIQSTAFKAITAGTFTNTNITVDANGAISSIASGTTPSTNAATIDIATAITGNPYFLTYSSSIGPTSILQAGGLSYDRTNNFLSTSVTNSTNLRLGAAGQIPYQSAASTTLFTAVGTAGQVLSSNGTSAPTWTTDIGGNSATSTAVALTGDDASGDWFIPYSKTSSATSNALYIDNTTTPLTYNANFGRMSAAAYTVGDKIQTAGTNSSLIRQTSAIIDYINNATSGSHRFTVNNATPTAVIPLTIGSTSINTVVPLAIVSTSGSTFGLSIKDSASPNQINFNASAGGGSLNALTVAGDCLISPSGTVNTEVLTLTTYSNTTTTGVRISPTAVTLGAGGSVATPTNRIAIDGTAGTLAITAVNTPTMSAPVPAAADSSTNIATTAWVQSAIPLGTVANISGGLAGNVLYQSAPSVTAELPNGASGTVLTSGGVGANPSWSANIAGNAGSATLVNLTAAVSGSGEFLTVSTTASGNSALRTNASLLYNHVSNTITGNVTGSAGSSALSDNLTGGVIGNILYQGNSGLTTRMVNGAAGRILTSNGVGSVPTWNNTFSGTSTAATNAVNTGITNDLVSTTNHALTFVANTTGNNPQKTRADLGTGEGLIFIPSSTTLICRIGGAGTISTATLNLKDNLGDSGDITYTGGTMNIRNNSNGNAIQMQVKDLVGTTFSSVVTTIDSTITNNKLETRAGIVGPTTALTYTSNMIGYTIQKNGTSVNFNVASGTIYSLHASGTNGVTLAAGIWMITLYVNFQPPAAAATVNFTTTGLSTDGVTPYTYVGGIGAVSVSGTFSIPNTANSRVTGSITLTMVSDGSTYYQLVNMTHTFATMSCLATQCFFKATRIA
jgi:hypothetical protein